MAVEISKVAGVDAPGTIVGTVGERCPGCLGAGKHGIDLRSFRDGMTDAELAAMRWSERNVGVLRELYTRVQQKEQPTP